MGGFDGESAFDLNDVWSWEENVNQIDSVDERLVCTSAGWSGRDGHCAVVLRDQIFVLGGTDDPFLCKWSSSDGGVSWNCLLEVSPWPERWQHAAWYQESTSGSGSNEGVETAAGSGEEESFWRSIEETYPTYSIKFDATPSRTT